MDESEIRIAALELLLVELMADMPAEAILAVKRRIQAKLEIRIADEERSLRHTALRWIEDAQERYIEDET